MGGRQSLRVNASRKDTLMSLCPVTLKVQTLGVQVQSTSALHFKKSVNLFWLIWGINLKVLSLAHPF